MGRSLIFRMCFVFLSTVPVFAFAEKPVRFRDISYQEKNKQDDKKKDSKKPDKGATANQSTDPAKPVIKEVPKARKQLRPAVIVKPKVNVKTIKVIRPKVKRP